MTLGRKITNLRSLAGISQESLAEKLSVSRQSVSKWETGQATPKMETLVSICKIFGITLDDFMREDVSLAASGDMTKNGEKHRYFGTDGFRGEVSSVLNSDHAYRIGRFLGWYYSSPLSGCRKLNYRPRIVIGKDTRRSSYTIEYALAAGLTA
ncbi:MAG: helix-turn-helix domain-containing protein, partial [Clostridia bacterium]|nr:helix-turn-helix domain-containing protein [Clostridia bacterium]